MRLKQRERERLNRKYHLEEKGTLYVSGMLKQKIKAGGVKIKRYDERCQPPVKNQSEAVLQNTRWKGTTRTVLPDPTEASSFWSKIWSEEVGHNERASWLEDVEVEFNTTEVQENISITVEDIRNDVSKMANCKATALVLFRVSVLRN